MDEIVTMLDLLEPGESALAVLTDGRHFRMNDDGSGRSGNRKVDPQRDVDLFIVYHRPGKAGDAAKLYRAVYTGATPSTEPGRAVVSFEEVEPAGVTRSSWREFAATWANPVRYMSRPASSEPRNPTGQGDRRMHSGG
jgi:hypothetical protein